MDSTSLRSWTTTGVQNWIPIKLAAMEEAEELPHSNQRENNSISMANLFIKQAKQYAVARPSYPPELFRYIASKTPRHDLVWDVGTGTGQAASSVSFLTDLMRLPAFF